MFVHRKPQWDGTDYVDVDTGIVLPTWQEALDRAETSEPAHVARFGKQLDMAGIIAPSEDANRAIRYLTKYLTKSIADAFTPDDDDTVPDPRHTAHVDRLHEELRWLPCSERCANWLRYGIQPHEPTAGLVAGRCPGKAHERENLGLGGRRVLVSRQWSGKTLTGHRADRASVVREALESAGMLGPELERMAATVTASDGKPRFVWTDTRPDSDHLRPVPDGDRRRTIALARAVRRREGTRWDCAHRLSRRPCELGSAATGPAP